MPAKPAFPSSVRFSPATIPRPCALAGFLSALLRARPERRRRQGRSQRHSATDPSLALAIPATGPVSARLFLLG